MESVLYGHCSCQWLSLDCTADDKGNDENNHNHNNNHNTMTTTTTLNGNTNSCSSCLTPVSFSYTPISAVNIYRFYSNYLNELSMYICRHFPNERVTDAPQISQQCHVTSHTPTQTPHSSTIIRNHPQSSSATGLPSPTKPVLQAFQGLPLQLNMQHGARQLLHGKAQAMGAAKGLGHREDARSVGRSDLTHGVAKHQGRHLTPPEKTALRNVEKECEKKVGAKPQA